MGRRRRRRWPVLLAWLLLLAWAMLAALGALRVRREASLARQEMAAGRLGPAARHLAAVAESRPGALGGAVDYLLGTCEALLGRDEAALDAFARVAEDSEYGPAAAFLRARSNLRRGRLRNAEGVLLRGLVRPGPDEDRLFGLLAHVYELQSRLDDLRQLHLRRLGRAEDPLPILRELDAVRRGRLPPDGLRAALEEAGRLAPEDRRVWLGKARLEIAAGRWDEAAGWLGRCLRSGTSPVWRAQLDWAIGDERPDEALRALEHLGEEAMEPAQFQATLAWLHARAGDEPGERRALAEWLRLDPAATPALERLADLADRDGEADREAELRRRKAEVDRALEAYRELLRRVASPLDPAEAVELARRAEAAGLRPEARSLLGAGLRADPGRPEALDGLARLDADEAGRVPRPPSRGGPRVNLPARRALERPAPVVPPFVDEAEAAGLHPAREGDPSATRRPPGPTGGGVAPLDGDGDGRLDVDWVRGGPSPPDPDRPPPGDRLYRNRGDGTFEDMTEAASPGGDRGWPRRHPGVRRAGRRRRPAGRQAAVPGVAGSSRCRSRRRTGPPPTPSRSADARRRSRADRLAIGPPDRIGRRRRAAPPRPPAVPAGRGRAVRPGAGPATGACPVPLLPTLARRPGATAAVGWGGALGRGVGARGARGWTTRRTCGGPSRPVAGGSPPGSRRSAR